MNMLNKLLILFFVVTMIGCASAYKPSQDAVVLSTSMTKQEAVNTIKPLLFKAEQGEGICRANGIPGQSLINAGWLLDRKNPKVTANAHEISFNAERMVETHQAQGPISSGGLANSYSTSTQYESFRRTIKYTDFESATIYKEVGVLSMVCNFAEDEVEVRFSLATGIGHWVNVVVKENELDKFVAALMVVSPNIELKMN